jgi:peptidoglycan/LPS O-acetylase OafA/YrhL
MSKVTARIEVLDFLRGTASLSVALYHFCNILDPGVLKSVSDYGRFGVQVFFVISGFIIPYSLFRSGYRWKDYSIFIVKRLTRLDPPYIATLIVIIALGVLSWYIPFQRGEIFTVSVPQVLLHIGYVNVFFGYPWLNDVFWTLAIEFQYYLLVGLAFPLLFSRNHVTRLASIILLGSTVYVFPSGSFVFHYMFLFLLGILTCQLKLSMIGKIEYSILTVLIIGLSFNALAVPSTIAGGIATFTILFVKIRNPVWRFLGNISYSLYLVHSPIGRRFLNLTVTLLQLQTQTGKIFAVVVATAASIAAAYVLYRLVEKPAQEWSASFRYKREGSAPAGLRADEPIQLNPAL